MSGEVGTTAPAFNLLDTDGNEFNSSSFAGKKTVIAFFPAAFSGVCAEELCSFRDALADFSAVDAEVIGVSIDDSPTVLSVMRTIFHSHCSAITSSRQSPTTMLFGLTLLVWTVTQPPDGRYS